MNALLRPRQPVVPEPVTLEPVASDTAPRRMPAAVSCAAAFAALSIFSALSGCVVAPPPPPSGAILSRLASGQPGAAESAHPLSAEEQKRYADIDKQVIREQNEAIAADAWARYLRTVLLFAARYLRQLLRWMEQRMGCGVLQPRLLSGWVVVTR